MGAANDLGNSQIIEYLKSLDSRITTIENRLNIFTSEESNQQKAITSEDDSIEPKLFELNIGEHWFANMGILILTFGFILLLTLKYENYSPFYPSIGGYVITSLFFLFANYLKENYVFVSKQLFASGFTLLYISTLRLFHFSVEQASSSVVLEVFLLLSISFIGIFIAYRKDSNYLFGLNLGLLIITGLVINIPGLFYFIVISSSLILLYRFIKNTSTSFILFGITFIYLSFLIWTLNNPIITSQLELGHYNETNILVVLVIGVILSLSNIINKYQNDATDPSVVISLTNGIFCFSLAILNIVSTASINSMTYLTLIFILFLCIAAGHWKYGSEKYSKAIYALIGYTALSAGIIFVADMPDAYIYLIWQSLLVVCTAILFKSKNIIVANFLIFLIIFVAYLTTVTSFSIIGLSFGIVGLISARVLNWQKHRLTLKTELMRNTYLIVAFFSIPITLIKSLPDEFVGLSLLGVTILYYVFSVVLKNYKYRWMAHFSLLFAIIYSAIVGITNFNSTWTVVTFLALGVALVAISLIFTKNKLKTSGDNNKPKENSQSV